jgi:peptidoglycan biosynthesis protein MviN/MurJ (putative lipid II flippase)
MTFLLAKLSDAASDREESAKVVRTTLAISMAYFLPVSLFISATARPVVSLIYGWGNFGAYSVDMTVTAISAYSLGITFGTASSILYRYAQATQRLDSMVPLSFLLIGVNWLLVWLMVLRWGILGLALATSITQAVGFALCYVVLVGRGLPSFLIRSRFFIQLSLSAALALASHWSGAFGFAAHIASALLLAILYFWAADGLRIMPFVPEHWRPIKLASFLLKSARSYFPA